VRDGIEELRFLSIYSTFDKDGVPLQRVALVSDVTDQRVARELIKHEKLRDISQLAVSEIRRVSNTRLY
jgi:hypothetical protein